MENNKSWIIIGIIIGIIGVGLAFWIGTKFHELTEPESEATNQTDNNNENNINNGYNNTIDNYIDARISNFQNEVRSVYRTAQNQFLGDSITLGFGDDIIYTNETIDCPLGTKTLDMTGISNFKYYVVLTASGQVTAVRATNGTYSYKYDMKVNSESDFGIKIEDIVVRDVNGKNQLDNYNVNMNVCLGK